MPLIILSRLQTSRWKNQQTKFKKWMMMALLPQPRGYVQAAELNGKLYIVCGVDQVISDTYQVHNETWVYDPIGNTWSQAARGPNGGDVASTYVYNPDNNTWLTRAPIISGTRSLAGALDDRVYLVGGFISARRAR